MLTLDTVTPVVTNTSVRSDLLHSLNILTHGSNQHVDGAVGGLTSGKIPLSVYEIIGNLELLGVHDDGNQLLNLFVGKGTSTTVYIDLSLLADQVGETLANTTNSGHGEHALSLALNIGVQHTQDVLKLVSHLQTL